MKNILLISFFLILFIGCNGKQDSTADNLDSNIHLNDTTLDNLIPDSSALENPYLFLEDTIEGVKNEMIYQREDGLRIEWIVKENDPIILNEVIMVNYTARVATGEVYDSNEEIGFPVPLKTNIGMMITGWETALLKMNIGDEGRIMIPSSLAYGENGNTNIVPQNADIIVDIEIVKRIKPIVLDEGVKVYTWKKNKTGNLPQKEQEIRFDYFAYTMGEKGKMYNNSYADSEPFSFIFENDNVMDGLHQGMQVIREGENAFIEIPANLAYGSKGLVDLVPKNTPIVYDVRVISVK